MSGPKPVYCKVCGAYIGDSIEGVIYKFGAPVPPTCPFCGAKAEVSE